MKDKVTKTFVFKTTAIGGLIFLLPMVVIGAVLGYAYNVMLVIYKPLKEYLPVSSFGRMILITKTAWGGQSLSDDYRSPSAGS